MKDSVPKTFSGIVAKFDEAIHIWCGIDFFELMHCREEYEWNKANERETVYELEVKRNGGSKIVPYSPLCHLVMECTLLLRKRMGSFS